MRILGIDYGDAKVGVAYAETPIAEPLEVIRYKTAEELLEKLTQLIKSHNIERVVVGESEQESKNKAHDFGDLLQKKLQYFYNLFLKVIQDSRVNISYHSNLR
jgi:RNase H-fold protein (predicted Holliday junction resolvase)